MHQGSNKALLGVPGLNGKGSTCRNHDVATFIYGDLDHVWGFQQKWRWNHKDSNKR